MRLFLEIDLRSSHQKQFHGKTNKAPSSFRNSLPPTILANGTWIDRRSRLQCTAMAIRQIRLASRHVIKEMGETSFLQTTITRTRRIRIEFIPANLACGDLWDCNTAFMHAPGSLMSQVAHESRKAGVTSPSRNWSFVCLLNQSFYPTWVRCKTPHMAKWQRCEWGLHT